MTHETEKREEELLLQLEDSYLRIAIKDDVITGWKINSDAQLKVISDLQSQLERAKEEIGELRKERDAYYDELLKYRQESAKHRKLVEALKGLKIQQARKENASELFHCVLASEVRNLLKGGE